MPDNLNYSIPASGVPVSTQETTIDTVLQHLQRIKIGIGPKGSYQEDLRFGATVATSSLPVVLATDQIVRTGAIPTAGLTDTLPSGQYPSTVANFNYGYDTTNNVWRRTPFATSTPVNTTTTSYPVTRVAGPVYNQNRLGDKSSYLASSDTVTMSTVNGTNTSIAYLWHASGNPQRVSLQKMMLSYVTAPGGSGEFTVSVARITAENGTPGGTSHTIISEDGSQAATNCTFRSGAATPTRATGNAMSFIFSGDTTGQLDLTDILEGRGLIARSSTAEGWEVYATAGSGLTNAPKFRTSFIWTEE